MTRNTQAQTRQHGMCDARSAEELIADLFASAVFTTLDRGDEEFKTKLRAADIAAALARCKTSACGFYIWARVTGILCRVFGMASVSATSRVMQSMSSGSKRVADEDEDEDDDGIEGLAQALMKNPCALMSLDPSDPLMGKLLVSVLSMFPRAKTVGSIQSGTAHAQVKRIGLIARVRALALMRKKTLDEAPCPRKVVLGLTCGAPEYVVLEEDELMPVDVYREMLKLCGFSADCAGVYRALLLKPSGLMSEWAANLLDPSAFRPGFNGVSIHSASVATAAILANVLRRLPVTLSPYNLACRIPQGALRREDVAILLDYNPSTRMFFGRDMSGTNAGWIPEAWVGPTARKTYTELALIRTAYHAGRALAMTTLAVRDLGVALTTRLGKAIHRRCVAMIGGGDGIFSASIMSVVYCRLREEAAQSGSGSGSLWPSLLSLPWMMRTVVSEPALMWLPGKGVPEMTVLRKAYCDNGAARDLCRLSQETCGSSGIQRGSEWRKEARAWLQRWTPDIADRGSGPDSVGVANASWFILETSLYNVASASMWPVGRCLHASFAPVAAFVIHDSGVFTAAWSVATHRLRVECRVGFEEARRQARETIDASMKAMAARGLPNEMQTYILRWFIRIVGGSFWEPTPRTHGLPETAWRVEKKAPM